MKGFAAVAIFILVAVFVASCGGGPSLAVDYEEEVVEIEQERPMPQPPCSSVRWPAIYVDGRTYAPVGWGMAEIFLDDTFIFIGEVSGHVARIEDATENLQTNVPAYVGGRLYQSGDRIIMNLHGVYTLFFVTTQVED